MKRALTIAALLCVSSHASAQTIATCDPVIPDGLGDLTITIDGVVVHQAKPFVPPPPPAAALLDPHVRVSMCSTFVGASFDAGLRNPVMRVELPIAKIPHAPMSDDDFAKAITGVTLPVPWGDDKGSWKIEGSGSDAKIVVSGGGEPGMFVQSFLPVQIMVGGHLVQADVTVAGVRADETANARTTMATTLSVKQDSLGLLGRSLAVEQGWIADPSTIPFDSEAARASAKNDLAADEATIEKMRPLLEDGWKKADDGLRAAAWSFLLSGDKEYGVWTKDAMAASNAAVAEKGSIAQDEEALSELRALKDPPADAIAEIQAQLDGEQARGAAAKARFDADAAKIEARLAASGVTHDDVLAAAEGFVLPGDGVEADHFRRAIAMATVDRDDLDHLNAMAAQERDGKLADAKISVPKLQKEIADARAEIADLQSKLADPTWRQTRDVASTVPCSDASASSVATARPKAP